MESSAECAASDCAELSSGESPRLPAVAALIGQGGAGRDSPFAAVASDSNDAATDDAVIVEEDLPDDGEIDVLALLAIDPDADPDERGAEVAETGAGDTWQADFPKPGSVETSDDSVPAVGQDTFSSTTVWTSLTESGVESALWPWPGTQNYSAAPAEAECDAQDAVRISDASQLYLLSDPNFRIFCLAAGDYTVADRLEINDLSGTSARPRVVRAESDLHDSALAFAEAEIVDLPTLPPLVLKNSNHWQFVGLRWVSAESPLSLQGADNVLVDRARVQIDGGAITVRDSDQFRFQRSLVVGSASQATHCLSIALAAGGATSITNAEFRGCGRALSVVTEGDDSISDVLIAGSGFHYASERAGLCDATGIWLDIADGQQSSSARLLDNQLSGWRAAEDCTQSAGVAVHASSRVGGLKLERNVLWENDLGVALEDNAGPVEMLDNVLLGNESSRAVRVGTGSERVSLFSNHFVRLASWLISERGHISSSCNLIALSGFPSVPIGPNAAISASSYVSAQSAVLPSGDGADQILSGVASTLGELCLDTQALSGPTEVCLAWAARNPIKVHCGSDHWLVESG